MRVYNEHIPLLQWDTPLSRVPRLWLQQVEPKLLRGSGGGSPTCWLWADEQGPLDCDVNGEPRIRLKGTQVLAKHFVARIFWPNIKCSGKDALHFVYHHCGTINCLNPNHFLVLYDHPSQINLDAEIRAKRTSLKRWRAKQHWKGRFNEKNG